MIGHVNALHKRQIHGWMTRGLRPYQAEFQPHQDNGLVKMNGRLQFATEPPLRLNRFLPQKNICYP